LYNNYEADIFHIRPHSQLSGVLKNTLKGIQPTTLAWLLFLVLLLASEKLELTMVGHVLIQLPLLVICGWLIAPSLPPRWKSAIEKYNEYGIPGILIVTFAVAYWMLPRSLDAALATPFMEFTKFVTLPMLIGIPLALSWPLLAPVAKGFVIGNLLSMLTVLGWLYTQAPIRLCNYYLINEQQQVGTLLLTITAGIALYFTLKCFFSNKNLEVGAL
jgi:hypothetical protein|tara:strand:+ start:345 stop:992 length:648 start_codon:yes stop_codon:yes gene_type:complete